MNSEPDINAATVVIPVTIVNGRPELACGAPLPQLEDGATGRLIVPERSLPSALLRRRLQEQRGVPFLDCGTELLFEVNPDKVPSRLHDAIRWEDNVLSRTRGTFVDAVLSRPLRLLLRGSKRAILEDCECFIPSLNRSAGSVNSAYFVITQDFQPERRARGGNVFLHCFYRSGNSWFPLDSLRQQHESRLADSIALTALLAAMHEASASLRNPPPQQASLFPEEADEFRPAAVMYVLETYEPQFVKILAQHLRERRQAGAAIQERIASAYAAACNGRRPGSAVVVDHAAIGRDLWQLLNERDLGRDPMAAAEALTRLALRINDLSCAGNELDDPLIDDVVAFINPLFQALLKHHLS